MVTKAEIPPAEVHPNTGAGIVRRLGKIAIVFVLQPVKVLYAGGRLLMFTSG